MRRLQAVLVLTLMVLIGSGVAEAGEWKGTGIDTVLCFDNPCFGSSQNDVIFGTGASEQIHALQGDDRLSAFAGSDVIAGDANLQEERFLLRAPGPATITDGDDQIDAGSGNDGPVRTYGGSDVISGGEGDDRLDAREFSRKPGSDSVSGGPGDDVIRAQDGAYDEIDCGEGTDTVETFDEGMDFVASNCELFAPA